MSTQKPKSEKRTTHTVRLGSCWCDECPLKLLLAGGEVGQVLRVQLAAQGAGIWVVAVDLTPQSLLFNRLQTEESLSAAAMSLSRCSSVNFSLPGSGISSELNCTLSVGFKPARSKISFAAETALESCFDSLMTSSSLSIAGSVPTVLQTTDGQ